MASTVCNYFPKRGLKTFQQAKKELGYDNAWNLVYTVIEDKYYRKYKDSFRFDSERIPSFNDAMGTQEVQNVISNGALQRYNENKYPHLDDTSDNLRILLNKALAFNMEGNKKFVAYIDYDEDGKLMIVIADRNKETMKIFNDQMSAMMLNQRLATMLESIGVTVGNLTDAETEAGRVGVIDFSEAKNVAGQFNSLIRVANNMEGEMALSEEFSHLMVKLFQDNDLVKRSMLLLRDDQTLREVLKEEYDDVRDWSVAMAEDNPERDVNSFMAEEALGKILQENLLQRQQRDKHPIIARLVRFIRKIFSKFNPNEIQRIIFEVDQNMGQLAKNILTDDSTLAGIDVARTIDNYQLNRLSTRIDRNIDLLSKIKRNEIKLSKIFKSQADQKNAVITELTNIEKSNDEIQMFEGLLKYSKNVLQQITRLNEEFAKVPTMDQTQLFGFLRSANTYVQCYGQITDMISSEIAEEMKNPDSIWTKVYHTPEGDVSIIDIVKSIEFTNKQIIKNFLDIAFPAFAKFLEPFYGKNVRAALEKYAHHPVSVEDILRSADSDVSYLGMWLDSAGHSSDVLLQLYDDAVKDKKDKARALTIEWINKINQLRIDAEKLGITEFTWMYETYRNGDRTGDYIQEYNMKQFFRDREEYEKYLDEKYGKNPEGANAQQKIADRRAWLASKNIQRNAQTGDIYSEQYRSKQWDKLTENQKKIFNEFMAIKTSLDKNYPKDRTSANKAVQNRKSRSERLFKTITSPSSLFENAKRALEEKFLDMEDDDQIFGERTTGLTNFDGSEFMMLPVLYTTRLKNPNELSDDLFGSLIQYAYSSTLYSQINSIVDALEVGRLLAFEREMPKSKGDKIVKEVLSHMGEKFEMKAKNTRSNFLHQLGTFMESQVYQRYMRDEGTFEILGKKVSASKVGSEWLKLASLAQLGCNFLANLGNVTNGIAMTNVEAFANQYFSPSQLAYADGQYFANFMGFTADMGRRIKQNKLTLFDELFNIRESFKKRVKHSQKKSIVERLFGADFMFLGQDAGDHWLYNRVAIAMAKEKEVLLKGKKTNLWNALQVKKDGDIYRLNPEEITELDGRPLDVAEFGRRVEKVNHRLFGVYDEDNSNAANMIVLGKALQQYRKWMKPLYDARFMKKQVDIELDQEIEGFHRTMLRCGPQLLRGLIQGQIMDEWKNLEEFERKNIIRSIVEFSQFTALWAMVTYINWPNEKDRPALIRLAEYAARRTLHEVGGVVPSLRMFNEIGKTLQNPIPSMSVAMSTMRMIGSILSPSDWVDELQSGPYKGHSTLYKNVAKAPLPIIAQYKQFMKATGELDTSIQYYLRPSY